MSENKPFLSILVYGAAGSGKSIFASSFPNALILDADGGHRFYEAYYPQHTYVHGSTCLIALQKAVEQLQTTGELKDSQGRKMDTIIIDSLTNIENLAISNAKGLNVTNWSSVLYNGKGKKLNYDDWGGVSGSTIAVLTFLRDLPINLVVITQIENQSDNGHIKFVPNLVGKGSNEALHFADIVGFLTVIETGKGRDRFLHLSSTSNDNFVAKTRTLQGDLDPIKNPNYNKLISLVTKEEIKLNFED